MKKYFYLVPYIVLIFVALPSCTKDTDTFDKDIDENPAEGENQTGRVVFWTSQSSGWSNLTVTVDGVSVGSTSKYFTSAPSCGSDGGITITKAPGTYSYTASSNTGITWNGTITIASGSCQTMRLDFPSGGGGSSKYYAFGSPQFVLSQSFSRIGFWQSSFIQDNMIIQSWGDAEHSNRSEPEKNYAYVPLLRIKNGIFTPLNFSVKCIPKSRRPVISGYALDPDANHLFFILDDILYQYNFINSQGPTKVAENFGTASALKISKSGEVFISTDINGGSIIKINNIGQVQSIAANLGAVGIFDIYNEDIFVVVKNFTGGVKKISKDGKVLDILSNINAPSNICFDKNGNFVLQESWTNDGATYQIYKIYSSSGQFIGNITDNQNTLIVSGENAVFTPLNIDSHNNLHFSHNSFTSNSNGITNCNPITNQPGIWKLSMVQKN